MELLDTKEFDWLFIDYPVPTLRLEAIQGAELRDNHCRTGDVFVLDDKGVDGTFLIHVGHVRKEQ